MTRNLIVVAVVAAIMAAFVLVARARTGAISPPVEGYVDGEVYRFAHTEASDPVIADTLADMTGSPVLVVPSLADAPPSMLARVYVFANGVRGDGPLGHQSDVFDAPPGTPGYRPLREVHMVRWVDERRARELRSEREIRAAERAGEVTIERTGAVVNMPFLTWPGGRR